MRSLLLSSVLFAFGSAQNPPEQCVYTANDGNFVLNLTEISDWTLEYEDPDHFYCTSSLFIHCPVHEGPLCQSFYNFCDSQITRRVVMV